MGSFRKFPARREKCREILIFREFQGGLEKRRLISSVIATIPWPNEQGILFTGAGTSWAGYRDNAEVLFLEPEGSVSRASRGAASV